MDANVDEIARDLAALTERFADLGARLGEAAQALQGAGAPPPGGLVEALAGARDRFQRLRSQALSVADAAGVTAGAQPQSLHDLEPVLSAITSAITQRARREALAQAQQSHVAVLDRALEILHQDDPAFPALAGCHAMARDVRAAILAHVELESEDARRVIDGVRPFADLLTLVEARDTLDDDRYAEAEESVSRAFGRALAVAAGRGKLGFEGDFDVIEAEPPPAEDEDAPAVRELEPDPVAAAQVSLEESFAALPTEAPEPEPAAAASVEVAAAPASEADAPTEPSGPDETAQWWLAAWARWSGWKSSLDFSAAVREELGKYPFLLSVPIQRSPEYEDGLLAYGYSILMDHVEKQNPGCVGSALTNLKPGPTRRVGEQLYDYLVTEGRLRETYADFVRNVLVAALPEPGVWFQFRILESREDTRVLQRPSARIGDTELSGQRLASEGQRYNEHKFKMTLGPLTTRFVLVSADVKEARGAGFKLVGDGAPSDAGWVVSVAQSSRSGGKPDARRLTEDGVHVPGLGKEHAAIWVAVFNPDPAADRRYELSVFLRKDAKSPFRAKS